MVVASRHPLGCSFIEYMQNCRSSAADAARVVSTGEARLLVTVDYVGTWIRHSLPLKRFKQQNTQEVTKVIVQGFR